jgi:nitrogen fixation/metabolism regulation signal transduction histidine kinase
MEQQQHVGKHQRSLKNFVLNPKMQFRMSIYFVAFGLAVLGIMLAAIFSQINQVHEIISLTQGIAVEQQLMIAHKLMGIVKVAMVFFLFILIAAAIYGVIVSHRIAGPMFAILAYIEELKKGNYSSTRELRPYDELIPIMESLHDLGRKLQEKK